MKNTQSFKRQIKAQGMTKAQLRAYVSGAWKQLSKRNKSILAEDKNKYINTIVNQLSYIPDQKFNPYQILTQIAKNQSRRTPQAVMFFSVFRNEAPSVYSRYNSMLYRMGLSSAQYFYSNAKFEAQGSVVMASVEIPNGLVLVIEIDMSQSVLINAELS